MGSSWLGRTRRAVRQEQGGLAGTWADGYWDGGCHPWPVRLLLATGVRLHPQLRLGAALQQRKAPTVATKQRLTSIWMRSMVPASELRRRVKSSCLTEKITKLDGSGKISSRAKLWAVLKCTKSLEPFDGINRNLKIFSNTEPTCTYVSLI